MSQLTFTPRGRLMLLLGDHLIRDAGIAVFELVKNAYDADATKCVIRLHGVQSDNASARIAIEDDGVGMDLATVIEIWLSPGARHRLTQREIVDGLTWLASRSGVTEVAADTLIRHCLFATSFRFTSHQIAVTNGLDFGDPCFTVQGSRRLLMAALMNLIDNAIYWVDANRLTERRVFVGTTNELTGCPAFVVADNGPGLRDAPEYLTMPFFTRKPDGLGLGLHIADQIMKWHGGRITFPEHGDVRLPQEFDGAVVVMQFDEETK